MEQLANRFTKLIKDNHPLNQNEDSMISAVNGTLINTEENQFIFQNLIGSLPAGSLKVGAKPLAVSKFRETLFIVSMYYNDAGEAVGEIGTYPSPNWNAFYTPGYNEEFIPIVEEYSPLRNFLSLDTEAPALYTDTTHIEEFATIKFEFKGNLIELHNQLSYDGSINLILVDPNHPVRMINTRFALSEDGTKAKLIKRNQTKNTNTYSNKLFSATKLIKQANIIPTLDFVGVQPGGFFKGGAAKFYFRYIDTDGNVTDIIEESGLVVFAHDNKGANPTENTNKAVKFRLSNLDPQFSEVKVYYSFAASSFVETSEVLEINNIFDYSYTGTTTTLDITIFGNEDTNLYSRDLLNFDFTQLNSVRTATQNDNTLMLGNVKSLDSKILKKLQTLTAEVPIQEGHESITIAKVDAAYNITDGYSDPHKVYSKVGYWDAETYELGVVYILSNGRGTTPTMPLRGIDNITGTAVYTTNAVDASTSFVTDSPYGENALGVYRTSRRESLLKDNTPDGSVDPNTLTLEYEGYIKYLTIDTDLLKEKITAQGLTNEIEGYFLVRRERKKDAICQGYMTNTAAFPATKYLTAPNTSTMWEYFSSVGPEDRVYMRDKNEELRIIDLNSEMREHLIDLTQGIGSRLYGKIDCKFVPAPGRVFTAALSSAAPIFTEFLLQYLPNEDNTNNLRSQAVSLSASPRNRLAVKEINNFFTNNNSSKHTISRLPSNKRGYSTVGKVLPQVEPDIETLATAFYTGDALVNEPFFNTTFRTTQNIGINYSTKPIEMSILFPSPVAVRIKRTIVGKRRTTTVYVNETVRDIQALGFTLKTDSLRNLNYENLKDYEVKRLNYIIENQDAYSDNSFASRLSNSALFASRRYSTWNTGEFMYLVEDKWFKGQFVWLENGVKLQQQDYIDDDKLNELFKTDEQNKILTLNNITNKFLDIENLPMLKPDGYYAQLTGTNGKSGFVELPWLETTAANNAILNFAQNIGLAQTSKNAGLSFGSGVPRAASLAEDHLRYGSYLGILANLKPGATPYATIGDARLFLPTAFFQALGNKVETTGSLIPQGNVGIRTGGTFGGYLSSKNSAFEQFEDSKNDPMGVFATLYPQKEGPLSLEAWEANYRNTNFTTPYFRISKRYRLNENNGVIKLFDGDCYLSLTYKQIFVNSGIDGILTATKADAYREGNNSGALVERSLFMPLIHLSNYNLSLRCDDYTSETETQVLGGPRPANPVTNGLRAKNVKYHEAKAYNFGYNFTKGDRFYTTLNPRAPKFNTEYTNRLFVSNTDVTSDFTNGYRDFLGLNFKDYYPELGELVRLITLDDISYAIFENGVGMVPFKTRTMIPSSEGGLEVRDADILSTDMPLLSNVVGSNQQFSICATDRFLYGYHQNTNAIWKAYRKGLVVISDFAIQKDLVGFKKAGETLGDTTLTVITTYNSLTKSVVTSFLNSPKTITAATWDNVRTPRYLGALPEINQVPVLKPSADFAPHIIQPEQYATICYNQTLEVFEPNRSATLIFSDTVRGYAHGFITDYKENILAKYTSAATPCNFLGQQHEFMFEYVINQPAVVQKIVDNLMVTSNKSYPDLINYSIEDDFKVGLIAGGQNYSTAEPIRVRYEETPALGAATSFVILNGLVYFTAGKGYKHAKKLQKGHFQEVGTNTLKILGEIFIIDNKFYNQVLNADGTPYSLTSITDLPQFNELIKFGITLENIQYENDHMYISVGRQGSLIRDKAIKIKVSYSGNIYTTIHSIITKVSYT